MADDLYRMRGWACILQARDAGLCGRAEIAILAVGAVGVTSLGRRGALSRAVMRHRAALLDVPALGGHAGRLAMTSWAAWMVALRHRERGLALYQRPRGAHHLPAGRCWSRGGGGGEQVNADDMPASRCVASPGATRCAWCCDPRAGARGGREAVPRRRRADRATGGRGTRTGPAPHSRSGPRGSGCPSWMRVSTRPAVLEWLARAGCGRVLVAGSSLAV